MIHSKTGFKIREANVFRTLFRWNRCNPEFTKIPGLILVFLLIGSTDVYAQIQFVDENDDPIQVAAALQSQLLDEGSNPVNTITTWYSDGGFLNAEVQEVGSNLFRIIKGCSFEMDLQISNDQNSEQTLIIEKYTKRSLEGVLKQELQAWSDLGYYFAEAEVLRFVPISDRCKVDIEVEIITNGLVFISDLRFEGNRLNPASFLRRISFFEDSLTATPDNLERLKFSLQQSELFEQVDSPEVLSAGNDFLALIRVQEQSLNRFDGLLGYVPDSNGEGQVVGDLNLALWNVFADGNGLNFAYRRLEPEVSRLNIGVRQFWLGNIPIGLNGGFRFFQNDTTYQARNVHFGGDYLIGNGLRLIGSVDFENITGSQNTFTIEPGGSKQSGSFGFRYSSLSGGEVPRAGVKGEIQFGISNKTFDIDSLSGVSQQFIRSEFEGYLSTGKQSVFASRLTGFLLNADQITDIDLFRFGGANSFRGYTEEQFTASQLLWGDIEYRYLTNPTSYLFLFGAAGWYHRPKLLTENNNQFKRSEFLNALGFGLSYRVRVGRLKFTYAISPNDGLVNGKVHMAVTTRF